MKKHKEQGNIKKIFTSIHYRMFSISFSVFIFIMVVVAALAVELYENQENYIKMYQNQQQLFVNQLKISFSQMYQDGKTDTDVIEYLTKNVEASGSRFFVYTKGNEVLFAKNDITTKGLGSLSEKSAFYKSIENQDTTIQKAGFSVEGQFYEIAVISDIYTIKVDGSLIKHHYYILLAVGVMSLVLISLLVTLLGSWNRTQKKLEGTEKELDIRNEKMEIFSQETGAHVGDKTDMLAGEGETGIIQSQETEFYNIYTIRMLLEKSDDAQLKPLQMIFLNLVMENRYFTKDEIFGAMKQIQKNLNKVEVMGEIRKGQFVILAYRTSLEQAKKRMESIEDICKKIETQNGIKIRCRLVEESLEKAVKRFEAACR